MQRNQQGFTLVELIVVILLVSILSIYAASRFSGTSSISAYTAREQIISIIRQIQIDRMQSNASESKNILAITSSCLGSESACTELTSCSNEECRENVVSKRSDIFYNADVNFTASFASPITFDLRGNPSGDGVISITSSGSETEVCINAQGYIASGDSC
uniref:Type II secretion system protein n=2 Tax=Vibrio ziniensis TaxID=2711221 RepID=A0A6G7CMJ1_9VIBR|nr:type II secretion system protein [Vibrio ziniensis]QIH43263.1 type II secretion system protein [Vibrio ziniensis]